MCYFSARHFDLEFEAISRSEHQDYEKCEFIVMFDMATARCIV